MSCKLNGLNAVIRDSRKTLPYLRATDDFTHFFQNLSADKEPDLSRVEQIERTRSRASPVRRGLQEEHAIEDDTWGRITRGHGFCPWFSW